MAGTVALGCGRSVLLALALVPMDVGSAVPIGVSCRALVCSVVVGGEVVGSVAVGKVAVVWGTHNILAPGTRCIRGWCCGNKLHDVQYLWLGVTVDPSPGTAHFA